MMCYVQREINAIIFTREVSWSKINWCRNISFSTRLKTNFIKKVDLLTYIFYYISNEVIKYLFYNKKKPQTISQSWKLHKIILTKKNYKCVHCVIISVNLFDDAVEDICTVKPPWCSG